MADESAIARPAESLTSPRSGKEINSDVIRARAQRVADSSWHLDTDDSSVIAGEWLSEAIEKLASENVPALLDLVASLQAEVAKYQGGEWRTSRGHKHPGNDVTIWWGEDCIGPYAGEFVSDVWYGPARPYVPEVDTDA